MSLPVGIQPAQAHEAGTVLALIEALLAELGDEGQEFAQIDRGMLRGRLEREMAPAAAPGCDSDPGSGRFLALLARDECGAAVGVLTLSTTFAVYAGGEYGVIDEMYVVPEYRSRGIGRGLVEAAVVVGNRRGWFRLDVTGPVGAGGGAGAGAGSDMRAGACAADDPALRFYRRMGFESTGQKLRLLVQRPPK